MGFIDFLMGDVPIGLIVFAVGFIFTLWIAGLTIASFRQEKTLDELKEQLRKQAQPPR